ncbi:TIGR03009 domain-containing protein [Rosistilla oblonga]|uniref:TIGR03009 domain-containing protein n=1 Tax=Rosistilla oblonga TaxID=2527990 RepID=UPI003A97B67C
MMRLIRSIGLLGLLFAATCPAQQPATGQPARPGNSNAAAGAPAAQPFPALTAEQQNRLDQLLKAWESSSNSTKRLSASFKRWQFRPLQAPKEIHASWARGEVKYQAPAQGMYRVEEMLFFTGFDEQKAPIYKKQANQPGDWWVCTGKELLEFDRANKKCEILELPPEMQGTQIVSSPLPFVFNLNAQEMKDRYWLQELPPKEQGEYWLEAWPKHQKDRAEFLKVMIIIDAKQFLPKALVLFPPNFDQRNNPERDVYEFTDVQRNGNLFSKAMEGIFGQNFIDVTPPSDWKIIRNKFNPGPPPKMAQEQGNMQPGQAPQSR